jgi:pimeloyl-ACP methyl ester carboxylesterase
MRLPVFLFAALPLLPGPARAASRIPLSPCRLKNSAAQVSCGFLEVPEDRAHPEQRRIRLRVAVVPSLARSPQPDPLFLLAGGPGQAATEAFGPLLPAFDRVHRTRDLVLVDQRGTGSSNPLQCEIAKEDAPLAEQLRAEERDSDGAMRACLGKWDADPRWYTTSIAMKDLDEVRDALGYDRINLWGGSYGTRAALVYIREHGGHVRTATLDGVAPTDLALPLWFARDAQRALDLLFDACAQDSGCASAYPDLRGTFAKLLGDLQRAPAKAAVLDPITGRPTDVTITRDSFTTALRGILYQPDLAVLVPLTIARAARGDFGPFVAEAAGLQRGFARSLALGLLFSVACAEDVPTFTDADIERAAAGTFLGPGFIKRFAHVCSFWPRGEVAKGFHDPVKSDVPVLLLSGELDPVTPPSWAENAARTLSRHLSIVVPGVGHGATSEGCTAQLVARFIEAGTLDGLDASCTQRLKRPPFFVSFAGPLP